MTETDRPDALLLHIRRCLLATLLTLATCEVVASVFARFASPDVATLLFIFTFWWCGVRAVTDWLRKGTSKMADGQSREVVDKQMRGGGT